MSEITTSSTQLLTQAEASAADLRTHAQRVNETIDLIVSHENAFEEATLEPRLLIGIEITKAQEAFGMSNEERAQLGGDAKAALARGAKAAPNPLGFAAWLKREIPRLPRTTARKYATAFRSLGIPADSATPQQIRERLKDLRRVAGKNGLPMPSLASLCKAGKTPPADEVEVSEPEGESAQLRLEDAREYLHQWQASWDSFFSGGYLEDCGKKEFEAILEFTAHVRDRVKARLKTL